MKGSDMSEIKKNKKIKEGIKGVVTDVAIYIIIYET